MLNLSKRLKLAVIMAPLGVAALLTAGCGSGSSSSSTLLRVVDTAPSGTATSFVNGVQFGVPQTFVEASKYISTPAAADQLTFTLSTAPSVTFGPVSQTISAGSIYSAIIFGRADVTNNADIRYPKMTVTLDDRTSPGSGNSRVRVVNAAPDGTAVDVSLNTKSTQTNVGYTTVTGYNDVTAGAQAVKVVNTGTATSVATGSFTFNAGELYTVYVVESLGTGSPVYSVFVTNDSPTS